MSARLQIFQTISELTNYASWTGNAELTAKLAKLESIALAEIVSARKANKPADYVSERSILVGRLVHETLSDVYPNDCSSEGSTLH